MNIITNQSSLTKVAPEYLELLHELQVRVINHFGAYFHAYYLLGSVGRGENIPGVSDMDTVIILRRAPNDEDELWEKAIQKEFEPKYPALSLLDVSCIQDEELNEPNEERLRFIFKTDSVLICGEDITSSFSSYPPGVKLAKLLNADYRKTLEDIRKDILEPDEEDQNNPKYVMECARWVSKKVLRLCLGIVMVDNGFYTRTMKIISEKFLDLYPNYKLQVEKALKQYIHPTSNVNEAVDFIDEMSISICQLADEKFNWV
jgi:hypothetical protein